MDRHDTQADGSTSTSACRLLISSALVDPSIGGVEHYVRWARAEMPHHGVVPTVLSCVGGPNGARPGADITVPTWWAGGFLPLALPVPRTFLTIWRAVGRSDAVLIQNLTHPLCLYTALAARLRRRPAVTMVHEADVPRYERRLLKWLKIAYDATFARITLRCAAPIAVSAFSARHLEGKYGRDVPFVPYPLGVLPTAPDDATDRSEPFTVVFAARYAVEKRPLDLVEVARALPDVRVRMFGNGPLRAECAAAASGLQNVSCDGGIPWVRVVEEYRACSAVVSASSHDNVQLGLLEPMSMGIPAVATSVGEAPSYFPGELARFLCAPGDVAALTAAVDELQRDYARWLPVFRANGERLRQLHAPGPVVRRTVELITAGR